MKKLAVRLLKLTLISAGLYAGIFMMVGSIPELQEKIIAHKLDSSVEFVSSKDRQAVGSQGELGFSTGTGFYIKAKSGKVVLITNAHVCMDSKEMVTFNGVPSSKTAVPHKVLKQNIFIDLCAIEVSTQDVPTLKIAKEPVQEFDQTYTLGYPLATRLFTKGHAQGKIDVPMHFPNIEQKKCPGQFTDLKKAQPTSFIELLQILAMLSQGIETMCSVKQNLVLISNQGIPGASGSPVVNSSGEVVGVLNMGLFELKAAAIIPASFLEDFLEDL